jgi:hypothetical protein
MLAVLCLLSGTVLAQGDTSKTEPGTLRTFEDDLTSPQPLDSVAYHPHHRGHRHHDDDDDTGGFWSGVISGLFNAIGEGYASLPNPNYGPYPYYGASGFYAHGIGNATHLTVGAGYERTHQDIHGLCTDIKFSVAALVVDVAYQQYQERTGGTAGRLHLAAIRIGARKAPGSAVLWQNHIGLRYVKGFHDQTGGLIGTELEIFPGNDLAITAGYDLDFFPRYGTVFHDLTGSASYFVSRIELIAGYHALITYRGSSLHGPFIGVTWYF